MRTRISFSGSGSRLAACFGLLPEPFRGGQRLEAQVRRVLAQEARQVEALGRIVHQLQVTLDDVRLPCLP